MANKYDKILDEYREKDTPPQLDSDPASPNPEDMWVLHETAGGGGSGSGEPLGFLFALTNAGGSVTHSYTLKYRTLEGTTVETALT